MSPNHEMNTQYGCQVSNRYSGYLDSSDYGNPVTEPNAKKRKSKKKRKPKIQPKYVDKAINTDATIELWNEMDENLASDEIELNTDANKENTFENDDSSKTTVSEPQMNTSADSGKCTESTSDGKMAEITSIKWSEICFQEEKELQHQLKMRDLAMKAAEADRVSQMIHPTMYFYSSNYRGFDRNRPAYQSEGYGNANLVYYDSETEVLFRGYRRKKYTKN